MGVSLKYDTDNIDAVSKKITTLRNDIEQARNNMLNGLTQIRQDWVSEGADTFFDSIDDEWIENVQHCLDTIDDLISTIDDASGKYKEIETEAPNYLKF